MMRIRRIDADQISAHPPYPHQSAVCSFIRNASCPRGIINRGQRFESDQQGFLHDVFGEFGVGINLRHA